MTRLAPARAGTERAENIAVKVQRALIAATQGRVRRLLVNDVEPVSLSSAPGANGLRPVRKGYIANGKQGSATAN